MTMAKSDATEHMLRAVDRLGPLIKEHAASAETHTRQRMVAPWRGKHKKLRVFMEILLRSLRGLDLTPKRLRGFA